MPPEFATVERELARSEHFVKDCMEGYRTQHSPDDDDYDPDTIVPDIENAIEGFLQTFDHIQHRLPWRGQADFDAHDEIDRRTKALIQNTKHTLIEIGCVEHYLDEWFSGYLREPEDE
jgi:hypothetical protein